MYIVDLNQVMISNFMVQIGNHTNIKVEEDLLRHMVLNSLRSYNVKFRDEYGEMIIACDDRGSWRKQIFPYYKANRKKDREDSELDWTAIFESLNKIREELKAHFPYRVIQIDSAEADDVIGTLCHEFGNTSEKILIISGDKDFRQLHGYMNVRQYDPVRKKWLEENNAERFLKEHIMKGDRGDGVPNFLSRDDCFVLNTRQKPLTTKKIDLWVTLDPQVFCDENMLRGWKRNEQMIDLNLIPTNIRTSVIESYNNQKDKGRDQLFTYFVEHKLKNLLPNINEF
jgi:hypothetical protein